MCMQKKLGGRVFLNDGAGEKQKFWRSPQAFPLLPSLPATAASFATHAYIFFLNRKSRIDEQPSAGVQVPWGAKGEGARVRWHFLKNQIKRGSGTGLQGHRDV